MASADRRFEQAVEQADRDRDASRAAVAVLKAAARLSQSLERALADAELTLPQFNVLMELAVVTDGALPQHEVIARLISTPSSLSWLTTRMRERGLITKERHADDARVVMLAITEAGWDALERGMPGVFAAERQAWRHHDRADLRTLAGLLDPLPASD